MGWLDLKALASGEWAYIANTEPVTLFRKLGDGQYDSGTSVANGLRAEVIKDGVKVKGRLDWLLWASQAGSTPAKPGDVVQDASGKRWVADKVDVQAYGARYFLETLQEH